VKRIVRQPAFVACVLLAAFAAPFAGAIPHPQDADCPTTQPATLTIDLDKALPIAIPSVTEDLHPVRFVTSAGKEGWVLRIPGGRPIATPAYADGMIFVGGGYGSHEFYAFDATTGQLVWQMKTGDDGPTAAVVDDGCVAFNTESCTVYVVAAKTGEVLWQEWLGDPLMSQPTIAEGRLYMAYPAGPRASLNTSPQINVVQQPQQAASEQAVPTTAAATPPVPSSGSHRLLCADLKTGRHLWEQSITADVISAPVVDGDKVYVTCFDGTSFCLDTADGTIVWKKHNSGTSAPIVADGHVVLTERQRVEQQVVEGLKRLDPEHGDDRDGQLLAAGKASYLERDQGGGVNLEKSTVQAMDASVGFATAPAAAQLAKANSNVGVYTVAGAWAYQGSRAAYCGGQIFNAQGRFMNCVRSKDGTIAWRATASGSGIAEEAQLFAPPAIGGEHMYLCSARGHLMSIRQEDGQVDFLYATGLPMAFQPALAKGNVYVGTASGLLLCLKTGDPDADGWYAWGGNAQHNKND
jgi:Ca-activated chloride channel family protein